MKPIIPFFLLFALSAAATTERGSEGGGGGDAVILPNGEVVLADIFLDLNAPQPNHMPPMRRLQPRLERHLAATAQVLVAAHQRIFPNRYLYRNSTLLKELGKLEADGGVKYYIVQDATELNHFCASGGRKNYVLPSGARVEQVACTSGDETFLVEPLFNQMTMLHQSLLLVHERLTTIRDAQGSKNFQAIARVTRGLGLYLETLYRQQQGQDSHLSTEEASRLQGLYDGLTELEFRDGGVPADALEWHIHPAGGALIRTTASVDPSAYVSVSSHIGKAVTIGRGSRVVNSVVGATGMPATLEDNVTLVDMWISGEGTVIPSGASASNGQYDWYSKDLVPQGMRAVPQRFVGSWRPTTWRGDLDELERAYRAFQDATYLFNNAHVLPQGWMVFGSRMQTSSTANLFGSIWQTTTVYRHRRIRLRDGGAHLHALTRMNFDVTLQSSPRITSNGIVTYTLFRGQLVPASPFFRCRTDTFGGQFSPHAAWFKQELARAGLEHSATESPGSIALRYCLPVVAE